MPQVVESLAAALHHACLVQLLPVDEPVIRTLPTAADEEPRRVQVFKPARPRPDQCQVDMFPQTWGSTALGFGGYGGQAITAAYTVVVEGPMGDAAVYFNGALAYHIRRPNEAFLQDKQNHCMVGCARAGKYETRTPT